MINKVILLGNVGADPETHVFDSGNKVVRLRVATTEKIFNPTTSVWSDHTEWHTVIVGQRHANFVEMYVKKGAQIYVEGRLRNREWGEGENRRFAVEIRVDEIKLLGRRSDSNSPSTYNAPTSQSSSTSYSTTSNVAPTTQPATPSVVQEQSTEHSSSYGGGSSNNNYGGASFEAEKKAPATPAWQTAEQQSDSGDTTTDDLPF
ncbi:MAG: single-stranded DNA-binding protein [Rikenellaceae bacterium]